MAAWHHLAILERYYIDEILAGRKTTECRLSKVRRAPVGAIRTGDILWLKIRSGPIVARATVRGVRFVDDLTHAKLTALRRRYGGTIRAKPGFFTAHKAAKYATFIRLCRVTAIGPWPFQERDRRAWLTLPGPICETGLGETLRSFDSGRSLTSHSHKFGERRLSPNCTAPLERIQAQIDTVLKISPRIRRLKAMN